MQLPFRLASKIPSLPLFNLVAPSAAQLPSEQDLEGFRKAQRVAQTSVQEISQLLQEGWTERQAADLLNTYLQDCGVRNFFHEAFVWFGERTRFDGIKTYAQYSPSQRVLLLSDAYILDVAPIFEGYACDVGFSGKFGENAAWDEAKKFLLQLRKEIPGLFSKGLTGGEIWRTLDQQIRDAGYDNIHSLYPFSVLGHRIHKTRIKKPRLKVLNFGLDSFWSLMSRGLFSQLLNSHHEGELTGFWAIEPHLGKKSFGIKFEEILVVEGAKARWLEKNPV